MHRSHRFFATLPLITLASICLVPAMRLKATTEIIVRSRYRIVLAADSRASYRGNRAATECKLFEVGDVYATVSGFAHYGRSNPIKEAVRQGFGGNGSFADRVSNTALILQRRLESQMSDLQLQDRNEYRYLMSPSTATSDFVQLAVAQTVREQPMLGIIELRRTGASNQFTLKTTICPGNCRQDAQVYYFGYWERIEPYVAGAGEARKVGSSAAIDRLIRLEIAAHPNEVSAPINVLELTASGARWLQNGGNCSLPGVSW